MLAADQIEKLKMVMYSVGWKEVMKPVIEGRHKTVKDLSFLLPSERPAPYKDLDDHTATAVLRGEAKALEWVLNAFQNEVAVYDFESRREELARQANGGEPAPTPANPV